MDRNNVRAEQVPEETKFTYPKNHRNSFRYFLTKGFAWFTCKKHDSDRHWPSAHAWCFIDLKEQKICYRYSQKCKKDNAKAKPGPEFIEDALQKMAEWVVKGFLIKNCTRSKR